MVCSRTALAQQQSQRQIRYFNREWDFNDVEISTLVRWLGRIGVDIPVTLDGRISGALSIGVPWGALRDARAWRFGGRLTSPRFTVEDYVVQRAVVRLAYRDGSLVLDELRLEIPARPNEAGGGAGQVTGSAQMEVVPRGNFNATIDVANLPIQAVFARIAVLQPIRGRFDGSISATVAVDNLAQLDAWTARGPLAVRGVSLRGFPAADASVLVVLNQRSLVARDFQLTFAGNAVTGSASLALGEPYAWVTHTHVEAPDLMGTLAQFEPLLPTGLVATVRASAERGAFTTDLGARGTLAPMAARASGQAVIAGLAINPPPLPTPGVKLRPFVVDEASLRYDLGADAIRLTDLTVRALGGECGGAVTVPINNGDVAGEFYWAHLRIADVLAAPLESAGLSSGALSIMVPRQSLGDLAAWQTSFNVGLTAATWNGVTVTDATTGDATIRAGTLAAPAVAFNVNGVPAALSLELGLAPPYRLNVAFNIPEANLARLTATPLLANFADRLSGTISASGNVSGALSPLVLNGEGRFDAQALTFDRRRIDALASDFTLVGNVVRLVNLRAEAYGGAAQGSATLPLDSAAKGAAALSWSNINLTAALEGISLDPIALDGLTGGSLTLEMPAGAFTKPEHWTGNAALTLDHLRVYDFDFLDLAAPRLLLRDGKLSAPQVAAVMDGRPVSASLDFELQTPYPLTVDVSATRFNARRLAGLPYLEAFRDRLTGRADTKTHLGVSFVPEVAVDVSGSLALDGVTYDDLQLERLTGNYHVTPSALSIDNLQAALYEGTIAGSASVPFTATAPGAFRISWTMINVGEIVTDLVRPPAPLTGVTTGNATIDVPPGQLAVPAAWAIAAHVEIPDLQSQGRQLASLTADVTQRDRRLTYTATGQLVEGRLDLQGERDPAWNATGLAALGAASLELRGASAATVQEFAAPSTPADKRLRGDFSLEFGTSATPQSWSWRAAASTGALAIGEDPITPGVVIRAAGDERGLAIQQVSGRFTGGELIGSGAWGVGDQGRRSLRVRLRQARIDQLQSLAAPDSNAPATGNVNLDVRIRPGAVWFIRADALASRAVVGGFALRSVRVPLTLQWSPRSGQMLITTTSSQLSLAGGRLSGRLTARRTVTWHVDGRFRFSRVDVAGLADSAYASGRLSGTLDISARNARSINELQATLLADLEGAQSRGIPVLDQIRNVVPGAQFSGATQFGQGRVEARLARGVVRLDQLTLASRQLQLFITGTVTLGGSLNLDALAATGQALNPTLAETLLSSLLAVPAAPAAVLIRANDLLANRVVHLTIRGTLSRPNIRLRPFQTLGEEAVRFFLRQSTGGIAGGRPLPVR
jgi:hypothetical protein